MLTNKEFIEKIVSEKIEPEVLAIMAIKTIKSARNTIDKIKERNYEKELELERFENGNTR